MKKDRENRGVYHGDYSPRYQEAFDIYEKAVCHIKKRKRELIRKSKKNEDK